jgi:hypothetical protein
MNGRVLVLRDEWFRSYSECNVLDVSIFSVYAIVFPLQSINLMRGIGIRIVRERRTSYVKIW